MVCSKFYDVVVDLDGGGGKGTWGKLMDTDPGSHIDRNDPNYDSGEVCVYLFSIFFNVHMTTTISYACIKFAIHTNI